MVSGSSSSSIHFRKNNKKQTNKQLFVYPHELYAKQGRRVGFLYTCISGYTLQVFKHCFSIIFLFFGHHNVFTIPYALFFGIFQIQIYINFQSKNFQIVRICLTCRSGETRKTEWCLPIIGIPTMSPQGNPLIL